MNQNRNPKWFNSPVTTHEGTLLDIGRFIPEFEKRSFSLEQPGRKQTRTNCRLSTIVRKPFENDPDYFPIAHFTEIGHRFQLKLAGDFTPNRPPVSLETGHPIGA